MKTFWIIIFLCFAWLGSGQVALAQSDSPVVDYRYARVNQTSDFEKEYNGETQTWQQIDIVTLSGDQKGTSYQFENNPYVFGTKDMYLRVGDKIIISYQKVGDKEIIAFSDYVRTNQILFLVIVFVLLLLIIGGLKGIRSVLGFGWMLLNIIILIKAILAGYNVYALVLVMSLMIVIGSSLILVGFNRKTLLVALSSLSGLLVSTILVLAVGKWAHFSEIGLEESHLFHLSEVLKKLDFVGIIYVGMIIGALGSMMDITISIVAGVEETINTAKDKKIRRFDSVGLFRSGLNIGREIMAVNANTLILAYAGSALTVWLVAISQGYTGSLLWNFNMIFVEILRIMAGTIGIFATIPMAAWLSSKLLIFERKYSFDSENIK
jgi:uncharacterized membrane protein